MIVRSLVWITHIFAGVQFITIAALLTYKLFKNFYQSSRDGITFTSEFHIYSKRYPTVSLVAVCEIILGTWGVITTIFTNLDVLHIYFSDGVYQNCCLNFSHLVWVTIVFIDGVTTLVIDNTDVPWPNRIKRLMNFFVTSTISVGLIDHALHDESHPLDTFIHILFAATIVVFTVCIALEIACPHSFLITYVRHLVIFVMGTWIIQIAFMETTNAYAKDPIWMEDNFSATDSRNTTFAIICFSIHVYGNAVLMLASYLFLANRWRKQDRMQCPQINNNTEYAYTKITRDVD